MDHGPSPSSTMELIIYVRVAYFIWTMVPVRIFCQFWMYVLHITFLFFFGEYEKMKWVSFNLVATFNYSYSYFD